MTDEQRGIVYLVGAGPGDPGLVTRRAAELLERADVVAYDRLVHPAVLALATRAELVDVGKRPGESGSRQPYINELIVSRARAGQAVVRLKGGDPFVFGRGGEEAEACADAGIPFEVVPGVTSAVAGPAYAGIPLTHRAHASWAALATGHEDPTKDATALDWSALAAAPTAVFLMGVGRLAAVTSELERAGRPGETPAAVVASATLPGQRVISSTLAKIADEVAAADVKPPAILVVGDVVRLAGRLDWFGRRPLSGKRVFVTRTRAQAGRLSVLLRELGADALEFPAIKTVPPSSYDALDASLAALGRYAWVVFTSANAVGVVWDRLAAAGRDARAFGGCRVAAVGPATADALRARGVVPDLVPGVFQAAGVAEGLGRPRRFAKQRRVLVPQATNAPGDLLQSLSSAGWRCDVAPTYSIEMDETSKDDGRRALDDGVDAVLFTSGSTVRSFVQLWGKPPDGAIVCCIGPRTAAAAEAEGVRVDAVADEQTVESLVGVLVGAVGR